MSQKDYKFEIVLAVQKEENHIRALAKKLATNQTTIARKVDELIEMNVVDYKEKGRNKVIFLKQGLEPRQYLAMAEHYRLIRSVKRFPRLRNICEKIQKDTKIQLAILFGSYAKGTPTAESDIDIYIETRDRNLKKSVELADSKASVTIGTVTLSPLMREIQKNHIIIKGVERYHDLFTQTQT